ncbi:hypothetical protein [Xiamenia xianingshaonis]|uniref:Uncharacterized protein n=1 Tax=Xiamenia xianingshaonis TaxID=2682776 RepID=A0A9E6MR26_9ACTN|nr:hypothetical protein [Xiamenia xianingshaonis]NHM14237.1 hypothetical protein [Xiamenia xianingshaonis]QTU84151.1 hypothetical protein J7S26_07310 [Xiamenia xianingshaonis]
MKLSSSQLRRFCRLYDAFMAFAEVRAAPSAFDGSLFAAASPEVVAEFRKIDGMCRIWTDPSIVDAFVEENPANLSPRELDVVREWKHALPGLFHIVLMPQHVSLFLLDDVVFEVRGLAMQVDEQLTRDDQAFAFTTLLPFDGAIVFARDLFMPPLPVDDDQYDDALRLACRAQADGDVVATARGFVEASKRAASSTLVIDELPNWENVRKASEVDGLGGLVGREGGEGASAAPDEPQVATADNVLPYAAPMIIPDDEPAQTHPCPLAGLSGEERDRRIEELTMGGASSLGSLLADFFSESAVKDPPDRTLRSLLLASKKADLQSIASSFGLRKLSQANKKQLADAIADQLLDSPGTFDALLETLTARELKSLRAQVEAGGEMPVSPESGEGALALPIAPLSFFVKTAEGVKRVVPTDLLEALSQVDWDNLIVEVMLFEEMRKVVEALVQLRGVETFEVLYGTYCAWKGTAIPYDVFADELRYQAEDDLSEFRCFCSGGTWYGVARDLYEEVTEEGMVELYRFAREHFEPRPLTAEMLYEANMFEWLFQRPASQAVLAFLDAHVPDDEDRELAFADDVVSELVVMAISCYSPQDVIDMLEATGLRLHERDFKELWDLVVNMVNTLPNWSLAGWSNEDAVARLA